MTQRSHDSRMLSICCIWEMFPLRWRISDLSLSLVQMRGRWLAPPRGRISSLSVDVDVGVAESNSTATRYVLCNTAAVLTEGRRCAEEGYTFVWKPAKDPYMITLEGMIVVLEHKAYIPYLEVGSSNCALFRPDDEDISLCTTVALTIWRHRPRIMKVSG